MPGGVPSFSASHCRLWGLSTQRGDINSIHPWVEARLSVKLAAVPKNQSSKLTASTSPQLLFCCCKSSLGRDSTLLCGPLSLSSIILQYFLLDAFLSTFSKGSYLPVLIPIIYLSLLYCLEVHSMIPEGQAATSVPSQLNFHIACHFWYF